LIGLSYYAKVSECTFANGTEKKMSFSLFCFGTFGRDDQFYSTPIASQWLSNNDAIYLSKYELNVT